MTLKLLTMGQISSPLFHPREKSHGIRMEISFPWTSLVFTFNTHQSKVGALQRWEIFEFNGQAICHLFVICWSELNLAQCKKITWEPSRLCTVQALKEIYTLHMVCRFRRRIYFFKSSNYAKLSVMNNLKTRKTCRIWVVGFFGEPLILQVFPFSKNESHHWGETQFS